VAVRGVSFGNRADARGDHVDFAPLSGIGGEGRENDHVGVGRRGNIRVAFQEVGKLAESADKRLPLRRVGVSRTASFPSMARGPVADMLSMSVIPSGLRNFRHAALMQFHCNFRAIGPGVMQARCK